MRSQFTLPCASNERTPRARWSRKRRSDRAETRQRLGAPSLGSGKLQTPPNRYPPAKLLLLLFEAISACFDQAADAAGKPATRNPSKGRPPACPSTEHRTRKV